MSPARQALSVSPWQRDGADAARLFCDAVEQPRRAACYHATAENGMAFRKTADAIGDGLGLHVQSVLSDRAERHLTELVIFAPMGA